MPCGSGVSPTGYECFTSPETSCTGAVPGGRNSTSDLPESNQLSRFDVCATTVIICESSAAPSCDAP